MLAIGSLPDTQGKYDVFWQLFLPLQLASIVVLALGLFKDRQYHRQYVGTVAAAFGGLPYISISWSLMLQLGLQSEQTMGSPGGWLYPVLLIAAIWINDTMAYIVGSLIGKTPLSKISPKKTWEGTIGGAVLAVVVITVLAVWLLQASWWQVAVISATAAVAGTLGDLLESWLKRMAGVKDSGNMMPGHGGFLDRFDSLLVATPFVWLLLRLIN
jgi:phosphatidate cytidylyltransferase